MAERNKILTVDDSCSMRRLIQMVVETIGYQAVGASNGKEALEILDQEAESIALVSIDWNMPVMDGLQTLRAIRQNERFEIIPVMMVTTDGTRSDVVEALRSGARHYLHKPFSQQDLAVCMLECLGRDLPGSFQWRQ